MNAIHAIDLKTCNACRLEKPVDALYRVRSGEERRQGRCIQCEKDGVLGPISARRASRTTAGTTASGAVRAGSAETDDHSVDEEDESIANANAVGVYAYDVFRSARAYEMATRREGDTVPIERGWSERDDLEIDRWANEAFAELRLGHPIRRACMFANRDVPEDLGDEEAPVSYALPIEQIGRSIRDVFSGGPAPTTILAERVLSGVRAQGVNDHRSAVLPAPAPRPLARTVLPAPRAAAEGLPRLSSSSRQPTPKEHPMPNQQQLIDALAVPKTNAELRESFGDGVSVTLSTLKHKGLVVNDGRGTAWRLTGNGDARKAITKEKKSAGRVSNVALNGHRKPKATKPAHRSNGASPSSPAGRGADPFVDQLLDKRDEYLKKVAAIDTAIKALVE